jgi:NAD(P)-dependent dehydrogenase (short-subunit alcohol dehydrogenase family)
MTLDGKVAVVTGGAWGIGRAIATALAGEGVRVVIADVDEEAGPRVAVELGATFVRADVSSEEEVSGLFSELDGLDILVNNACQGKPPPYFPEAPVQEWSSVLDLCLRGTMLCTHHAVELMRRHGGAILNVSSIAAFGPLPHSFVEYAVAKAALVRLTECLAPLAEGGIRVTCLAPDWRATEFVRERMDAMSPEELAEARDGFGRPAPERMLEPAEVAAAALQLLTDESLAGVTMVLEATDPPRLVRAQEWTP